MKTIIAILLLLLTNIVFAQNVIVVVIDGARYTETFGGDATYIPNLYNNLKPSGAVYTNFWIANEGKTETNPGHSSILTGTWQQIDNNGILNPTKPTVFEYFRKALSSSLTDNFVIAGKFKLNVISYSTDPLYGSAYQASTSCATLTDNQVYNNLISIMGTYQPKMIIVNLPDTDVKGHTGVWVDYVSALTNADYLVYQLWQLILQGDYGYTASNTTLFVTNDHGRHTANFSGHGDDCEGCEHIMLLALGKNVTQGIVNNDLHYQIDIAPTIGDLLGFSTPQAVGVSLFQGSNPLPVELSSFNATVISNAIKLNWATETEVNNYGFEILRQAQDDKEWTKIGFVNGNGNSNSPKNYAYEDKNVSAGKYYYRLKQIDNDGQFEYSKTIEVILDAPTKFELSQNYPNPFNPTTTISYNLPEASNVKLTIFNLPGQEIKTLVNEFKESGVHAVNFDASELNSGLYIYKLQAGSQVQTRKMTLIK